MTHTFYLKKPKSEKDSLILFSCSFKLEQKKFVYSTGENINPKDWDQKSKAPKHNIRTPGVKTVRNQLSRYAECFHETIARCQLMRIEFTSQILKEAMDLCFKKTVKGKNVLFDAYDQFVIEKNLNQEWSVSTSDRYGYLKTMLKDFEKVKNFKLSFVNVNKDFISVYTDYCMNTRNHGNNTYSRNLGLFKTFLYWAYENRLTYNDDFKKFKRKKQVITSQIALTKEEIQILMDAECKTKSLEKVRDVFVFGCVTGMRFGELKFISKGNINGNTLSLKEEKSSEKSERDIPLGEIARYILKKYDYKMPLIANQKHNKYIKTVFQNAGFIHEVQKVSLNGKIVTRTDTPYYKRVSSHTARRTFITMMKREGKSDKLISKITGHKDMKTLNTYYQVDNNEKKEAIDQVFSMEFKALKKV